MARYFNRTNGMLPVTLGAGKSVSIPGKSWTEIPADYEGAESVRTALRKGYLYRWEDPAPEAKPESKLEAVMHVEAVPALVRLESSETARSPEAVEGEEVDLAPIYETYASKPRRKKSEVSST